MTDLNIWAVWPTVDRDPEMIKAWKIFGYKVAVLVNPPFVNSYFPDADRVVVQKKWEGLPTAVNILCRSVPGNIVVLGSSDIYPDPNHTAEEIGEQFLKRFPDTYGVMQPTGDEFGSYDTCCISPWMGRAFIEKSYGGNGPYRKEYFHYFSDQEIQEYAIQEKAFEQRPDLIQYHDHWQRQEENERPGHLIQAKVKWGKDRMTFTKRKKKGFPNGTI